MCPTMSTQEFLVFSFKAVKLPDRSKQKCTCMHVSTHYKPMDKYYWSKNKKQNSIKLNMEHY